MRVTVLAAALVAASSVSSAPIPLGETEMLLESRGHFIEGLLANANDVWNKRPRVKKDAVNQEPVFTVNHGGEALLSSLKLPERLS